MKLGKMEADESGMMGREKAVCGAWRKEENDKMFMI